MLSNDWHPIRCTYLHTRANTHEGIIVTIQYCIADNLKAWDMTHMAQAKAHMKERQGTAFDTHTDGWRRREGALETDQKEVVVVVTRLWRALAHRQS